MKPDRIYSPDVKYILKTSRADEYEKMATSINLDHNIKIVIIQHEFGFFKEQEQAFLEFIYLLSKPVVVVFHTVLPYPDDLLIVNVQRIAAACTSIIVMTNYSATDINGNLWNTKTKNKCHSSRNTPGSSSEQESAEEKIRTEGSQDLIHLWTAQLR